MLVWKHFHLDLGLNFDTHLSTINDDTKLFLWGLGQLLAGRLLVRQLRADTCSLGHLLVWTFTRKSTCSYVGYLTSGFEYFLEGFSQDVDKKNTRWTDVQIIELYPIH